MKRVLVIAYYWPPSGGSGVQRWVKFVKYLPSEGWEPVVFAPRGADYPIRDTSLNAEVPASVEVLRGRIWEPYAAYRQLLGGKDASTQVTEISSGKKTVKQKLALWIRANLFVPDPRVSWVKPSVKTLQKYLKEHPVDAIVTTGPPHSVHLIGLRLHQLTGTPWISDFRDPWTKMYYLKYLPMLSSTRRSLQKMEQEVLDQSTAVLTCTPMVQEDFRTRTKTPVECITNGFDEKDFAGDAPKGDGLFNITHTGLLAADGNPQELWKVLGRLVVSVPGFREELRIRLVGKVDQEVLDSLAAAGLSENVVLLGPQKHAQAVREQRSASLLLLPLRNDEQYAPILPGKLFEYLAARRPILGVGQEEGAMAQLIFKARAGITADWENPAPMQAFIANAWRQHCGGGIPATDGDITPYTRQNLTKELAQLLEKVSENE